MQPSRLPSRRPGNAGLQSKGCQVRNWVYLGNLTYLFGQNSILLENVYQPHQEGHFALRFSLRLASPASPTAAYLVPGGVVFIANIHFLITVSSLFQPIYPYWVLDKHKFSHERDPILPVCALYKEIPEHLKPRRRHTAMEGPVVSRIGTVLLSLSNE